MDRDRVQASEDEILARDAASLRQVFRNVVAYGVEVITHGSCDLPTDLGDEEMDDIVETAMRSCLAQSGVRVEDLPHRRLRARQQSRLDPIPRESGDDVALGQAVDNLRISGAEDSALPSADKKSKTAGPHHGSQSGEGEDSQDHVSIDSMAGGSINDEMTRPNEQKAPEHSEPLRILSIGSKATDHSGDCYIVHTNQGLKVLSAEMIRKYGGEHLLQELWRNETNCEPVPQPASVSGSPRDKTTTSSE